MNIIFMYKGPLCEYLEYTLKAAVLSSPNHRVICISDRKFNVPRVEYYNWDDYAKDTKWFEDLTSFPESDVFHRRSFVRPAILSRFCEAHGIDRIFNVDADVIITDDLNEVCKDWSWCEFTMSLCDKAKAFIPGAGEVPVGHSNHSIMTLKSINAYIDFIKSYSKKVENIGCDMMTWTAFCALTDLPWANSSTVLDHNIGTQLDKYHNDGECKYLVWHNRKPFKVRQADNGEEPMPVIHCWSESKKHIHEWATKLWT